VDPPSAMPDMLPDARPECTPADRYACSSGAIVRPAASSCSQ
jgi:hypothetical protein